MASSTVLQLLNLFATFNCSPASPVGSLASSWPSAGESDGEAAALTPRPFGAFARQYHSGGSPVGGAAAAWQQNSSGARWRDENSALGAPAVAPGTPAAAPAAGAAAALRGGGTSHQQPAGSPDGAAPMQQDGGEAPTPSNPFERCAAAFLSRV